MKKGIFSIRENVALTETVFRMVLEGDVSDITMPGQFINIALEGFYLRRPISVYDWDVASVTIVYKVVGEGTKVMSGMLPGEKLDVLTGLGNGYDTTLSGDSPVLIGGGVGTPPLYALAKKLLSEGKHPTVILGFNTASEIFLVQDFLALGVPVLVATADGSYGVRGFVTDALAASGNSYTHVYTCGPEPMLKAVYDKTECGGQYSFEERMGCGFGACMGCSCKTKYGNKRICKDGPVLSREEIIW